MVKAARCFLAEEDGSSMVEFTLVFVLLMILTFGFVDFGYALFQWNSATKAVQAGARMAAISNPVVSQLATATDAAAMAAAGGQVGDPVPAGIYSYSCSPTDAAPYCGSEANDNFKQIFYGDPDDGGSYACGNPTGRLGMCDFFPRLKPSNVKIEYFSSGLGYWTRPDGPVPTVRVSLHNVTFDFLFLSVIGFNQITMPAMTTTVTGEDLGTCYPKSAC